MATINVTNSDNLETAIKDANQGDVIVLAAGNYPARKMTNITKNADAGGWATIPEKNVILRAANPNAPPRFNVGRFELDKVHGLTFDGIQFRGSANETPIAASAPGTYPDLREAIRVYNCKNTRFINCDVSWHLSSLRITNCDFIEILRSHFYECGIDNIMLYGSSRDVRIWNNLFDNPAIDYGRHKEDDRHPDNIQARVNTSQVGNTPMYRISVKRNLFDMTSKSGKPFFASTQDAALGVGYVDCQVEDNQSRTGRSNGIVFCGAKNCSVKGNTLINLSPTKEEEPRIWMKGANNEGGTGAGEIANNVMHRAIVFDGGAEASDFYVHDNVIDATGKKRPSGWTELVAGVNVGPYTDGGTTPTKPAQMAAEWSNPPTNSIPKDGRVATVVEAYGLPGLYTGEIVIPAASVAAAAMATNVTTAYTKVNNLEWTRPGLSGWYPCRVADPATNSAGWRRYEMMGGSGADANVHTVASGVTMSGISLRYSVNSIFSDGSPYTGSFTGAVAPTEPIPALTSGDWSAIAVVPDPLLAGRSTWRFRITGVTYTAAQWTIDGESPAVWRPTAQVGLDLELRPSAAGGSEHTVGYAGAPDASKSVRVRYSMDTGFGPGSADAKTFTGPAETMLPGVLDDWTIGDLLIDPDDVPLSVSGVQMVVAGPDIPPAPEPEDNPIFVSGGIVSITLSDGPPSGCVSLVVLYAGVVYPLPASTLRVSFPRVAGEDYVYACGVDADGHGGTLGFWPID